MPPAPRRPSWPANAALAVGTVLLLAGLLVAIWLGPSGRFEASTHSDSPGVVVIGKDALRASSTPVHVHVTAASGGSVTMVRMLEDDVHATLGTTRADAVDGVSFLPPALAHSVGGTGPMPHALNADTFLDQPVTGAAADADITPSRLPQALLAFPGAPGAARDDAVDVTMTWTNVAWFWESVLLALVGLALLLAGLLGRRAHRSARPRRAPRTGRAEGWTWAPGDTPPGRHSGSHRAAAPEEGS